MEVAVRDTTGASVGTIALDDRVFGIEPNRAVLHQAVVAQLANRRQGTANTLTRAQVRGGGKKPWRQKGTGRARAGTTRAPHWRGGGVVFGPHPRSYHQRLPRKMRRLALRSALSEKIASDAVIVVDRIQVEDARTKTLVGVLGSLGVEGSALVVLPEHDEAVRRASGNLANVRVALPNGLSLLELMGSDTVIFSRDAVEVVTRLLLGESSADGEAA
jgi:large subunit ribosomal protein L4